MRADRDRWVAKAEQNAIGEMRSSALVREARADLAMALAERDAAVSMGTQLERERDKARADLREAQAARVARDVKRAGRVPGE